MPTTGDSTHLPIHPRHALITARERLAALDADIGAAWKKFFDAIRREPRTIDPGGRRGNIGSDHRE